MFDLPRALILNVSNVFFFLQGFAVVAVMVARVRPSLNAAREAMKTWDEAAVVWPRIKVLQVQYQQPIH